MKGFELKYNDEIITASIKSGVTSIFIGKVDDTIHLAFRGLDNKINQHVTWFESIVNENDEIRIKVVDVYQVAEVIKSEPNKRNSSFESKLIEYRSVKKYLEKEGLIKKEE